MGSNDLKEKGGQQDTDAGPSSIPRDNMMINKGLEDQMSIEGYKVIRQRTVVTWVFIVLTLGFLRLVFYWKPHWFLYCTHIVCELHEADKVLLQDQYNLWFVETVKVQEADMLDRGVHVGDTETDKNPLEEKEHVRVKYFTNKKVKYIWDEKLYIYLRLKGLESDYPCSYFHETKGLTQKEQASRRLLYSSNTIIVRVTPILKLLVTEGLNPFYIFQLFSVTLWFIDEYVFYATAIVIISTISLTTQIYQTRAMQRALKHTITASEIVSVCRKSEDYEDIPSEDLVPGDILEIPRHGCTMQCDAVLISGNCIVNESMLTGESVPVTKTPLTNPKLLGSQAADTMFSLKEHSRHVLFCGTRVIQTRFYDKQKVRAVVLRTGFTTSKGELIRSIMFPKPTDFKFSQDSFKFIGVLFLISIIGMVYTFTIMISNGADIGRIIVRSLDLITIVVPPALPAAMTVGVVFAQRRLKKKNVFCISPNSINQCGALNLVCFDKTGTLTEDGLDMWGVVPSENSTFEEVQTEVENLGRRKIMCCMATCHSLTIIENVLSGDPLDYKMFEATGWELTEPGEDTTRYEVFMPTVVGPKKPDIVTVSETLASQQNIPFEVGILRQFTFSSKLQRMSVIARTLGSSHFELYAKGAPEMIASLCKQQTVPRNFHDVLMHYTQQGYRVIALAWKPLKKLSYVKVHRALREQLEVDLTFLGLLVMENRLKPQSTAVIRELKLAKIRPVMITGDNMLTALSVARDCHMIEPSGKVILVQVTPPINSQPAQIQWSYAEDMTTDVEEVVNGADSATVEIDDSDRIHFALTGRTWGMIRKHFPEVLSKLVVRGTVFARMSPEQKQQLVEMLQEVGYYVGMCGDGANDCGALKTAHAGISLSEAEASVASPFTSKDTNISCVPNVIREGRAALVTSFGIFKYMACYSLTQFSSVCIIYWIGANLTDGTFLYIDLFLLLTLSVTFAFTGGFEDIVPKAPQISLLSLAPILSILLQVVVNISVQLVVWFGVQDQPWYEPFVPNDDLDYQTHLVTAIFLISSFQYITLAVVFSKGAPYRKSILTNYLFLANIALCTVVSLYICIYPWDWVVDWMELHMPPIIPYRVLIAGLALINFFVSFIVETFLIDSRLIESLSDRVHRRHKADKGTEYMAIEEEIQTDPTWPSAAISSISLADLMRQESEINPDLHKVQANGGESLSHSFLQSDTDLDSSYSSSIPEGLGIGKRHHRSRKRQDSINSYENPGFMSEMAGDTVGLVPNSSPPNSPKANVPLLLPFGAGSSPHKQKGGDHIPLVMEEATPEDIPSSTCVTINESQLPPQVTKL